MVGVSNLGVGVSTLVAGLVVNRLSSQHARPDCLIASRGRYRFNGSGLLLALFLGPLSPSALAVNLAPEADPLALLPQAAQLTPAGQYAPATTRADESQNLLAARDNYLAAVQAFKQGDKQRYAALKAALSDYPLLPYLEYRELSRSLASLPYLKVDQFLDQNGHSVLGDQLLRQWLLLLEKRQRWHEYQSYYQAHLTDTDLQCHYLEARLRTGEEGAAEEVAALWNVGHSLPKACDDLLKLWQAGGHQSPALTWSRATKAIEKRNRTLARYLAKNGPESVRQPIQTLIEVDRTPTVLKQRARFAQSDAYTRHTILHGIERLARRDARLALQLWEGYDAQHLFEDSRRLQVQETLVVYLTRQQQGLLAAQLAKSMQDYNSEDMLESLFRDALVNGDWDGVSHWIALLPAELQQQPRWRYWATRAAEAQNLTQPPYQSIDANYRALASERTFYGFLAADRLGLPYQLEDKPTQTTADDLAVVQNSDDLLRARELFALGQIPQARQEWHYASRQFSPPQLEAAGALAATWGWHRSAIQAMIDARSWDDLSLRFPLAYQDLMQQAAREKSVNANLLFAIARQESAFAADARSPAGALGLMQLMPATARETARKAGIYYRKQDLLSPETNIALGSHYFTELLQRFGGNAALAAAAYNAGPHRVNQWLANGRDQLDQDIWVEAIPFKETRGYVQNVMMFSIIYAYRNGADELHRVLPPRNSAPDRQAATDVQGDQARSLMSP